MKQAHREVILFLDEIHTMVGAGAAEGGIDASNLLKPALARGELQCIGATTLDEYRKYIEKDTALERRFQPVLLDEPTIEETVEILHILRPRYEAHHKVDRQSEQVLWWASGGTGWKWILNFRKLIFFARHISLAFGT